MSYGTPGTRPACCFGMLLICQSANPKTLEKAQSVSRRSEGPRGPSVPSPRALPDEARAAAWRSLWDHLVLEASSELTPEPTDEPDDTDEDATQVYGRRGLPAAKLARGERRRSTP